MWSCIKKCFLGLYLLLQSPSGVFSLIALLVIGLVSIKQPAVGGTALAAFAAAVPAILAWVEHKETLAQLQAQVLSQPPIDNPKGQP